MSMFDNYNVFNEFKPTASNNEPNSSVKPSITTANGIGNGLGGQLNYNIEDRLKDTAQMQALDNVWGP
jgi:hypothetical protein